MRQRLNIREHSWRGNARSHPDCRVAPDPWPFIWAIRAPAYAVTEAAFKLGLGLGADDPDYERGREFFSEREDRIRLALVVAKCGYACAKAEAAVKNAVFDTDRNDPGTCWPQDTLQAIWRHKQALEVHLASQTDRPIRQYPRPPTSR